MKRPKLLIEEWLPAQAIGVECMRARGSSSALEPTTYFHVWWARRPLTASRAAVLASLLPADFNRDTFERLLGFGLPSEELVRRRALMDEGVQVEGGFGCGRAFTNPVFTDDVEEAHEEMKELWGDIPTVIDPMSGGGSLPLEAARVGLNVIANEYNPVACSVLEASLDYPFRFGAALAEKTRKWGKVWEERAAERLAPFFPREKMALVHAYIFARTVPCPDTGNPTPLVPDWTLLIQKGRQYVAVPKVLDKEAGQWSVEMAYVGKGAGEVPRPPQSTYGRGSGVSLFSNQVIPSDFIKAKAQQGEMKSALYAVAIKTNRLEFRPPESTDLIALEAAEKELARLRPQWEKDGIIPTEEYPQVTSDDRPRLYGMPRWADLFAPRQLLALGVLVEELRRLRSEIVKTEGEETGEAINHLLALVVDKFANHNCNTSKWENTRGVIKGKFDRHDFAFRPTFAELAPCVAGGGLAWALDNVMDAYEGIAKLPKTAPESMTLYQGSATNLLHLDDESVSAVVVDPPYADNVQYSELADFFYVWLKRTQGHRRPEWFTSYLCEHDEEAVVNVSRHRENGTLKAGEAKANAHVFYQKLMTDVFRECHRILREDGALTVMFTHKQQSAWSALFESLIAAGFTITATWPVQTESQHSLHQAQKNAAQSTVILVARKREPNAGRAYYDDAMKAEIQTVARETAARLKREGLNAVDQLVGAFGPAMEVYSRHDAVRTDTGDPFTVSEAIQVAADAVADWRVEQLAERGLEGVDPESRFVLLCWDVLGAAEFRFNEAMLLGRSVGIDVARLKETGLVSATGDKVKLLPAQERRREKPVCNEKEQLELLEGTGRGRRTRPSRMVHPADEYFVSAIDMCHALALRYLEAGGGQAGIGAARGMRLQQGWDTQSAPAKLMTALVNAAPQAVRFVVKGKKTAAEEFPEFRAWHAMLQPLFGIAPPEWKEPLAPVATLVDLADDAEDEADEEEAEE